MGAIAEGVLPAMLTREEVARLLRYESTDSLSRALPALQAGGMPPPIRRANRHLWNSGRLMAWLAGREGAP